MKILPANPQIWPGAQPRTEAPQTGQRPDIPASRGPAVAPQHPAAASTAHRVERPMPAEAPRPAPRGSFVNLLV